MYGDWSMPGYFLTPYGTLTLNASSGQRFLIDKDNSRVGHSLRVTKDKVPQGDGEIFHKRFSDGTELTLKLNLWVDNAPACGSDLREMSEELAGHLASILNGDGRFFWTPADYGDDRMMDAIRWLSPLVESHGENDLVSWEFAVDSPFPYVIDATQDTVAVPDSVATLVTNDGNAGFFPVIIVDGTTTLFTITNNSVVDDDGNPLEIVYDGFRPPAGGTITAPDIAEIDAFRNTIYKGIGGPPGDDTNLKPYIDPEQTDYFYLAPGANVILCVGADCEFQVNNAWVPA